MKRRNLWLIVVTLLVMVLVAACGGAATPAPEQPAAEQPAAEQPAAEQPAAEQPAAEQPMAEVDFDMPAGGYLERAVAGEFAGTTVIVDGPFTDEDEVKFMAGMKPFMDATGIDVQYIGSKEFEASISVRVDAGDAPDIADFPQPGLLASYLLR